MIPALSSALLRSCGAALAAVALAYLLVALVAVWWRRSLRLAAASCRAPASCSGPAVSVLKPLRGREPQLERCLRSFCEQRYAPLQIVFGVARADDPAVALVQRLQGEYPQLDLELVIDPATHGSSAKVSNLINMLAHARHDWLVLADADVEVPPGYLARVSAPLADPGVGIVTCPYRGRAESSLCSQLGAAFINGWFMPSVYVAALFGSREFAFGASIALRRDALESIGGFAAIADQLADDYRLGELTRRRGLATRLSEIVVDTWMHESSFSQLVDHELRWLRTIRAVRPLGYALSFVTFPLPVALIGWAIAGGGAATGWTLSAAVVARVMLHLGIRGDRSPAAQLWIIPLNDALGFALWCWGFASRRVRWQQVRYRIARDGSVQPIH